MARNNKALSKKDRKRKRFNKELRARRNRVSKFEILEDRRLLIADDKLEAILAVDDVTVCENEGQAIFHVHLSNPVLQDVTFSFQTQDGTAVAGDDYDSHSGNGVIPAGDTSLDITVDLIDDNVIENWEEFTLEIDDVVNAFYDGVPGYAHICDDDVPPTVSFDDVTVWESDEEVVFTLSLSEAVDAEVIYNVSTQDDTAHSGSDYVGHSESVTFAPNETVKTVTIDLIDDEGNCEKDEQFYLHANDWLGIHDTVSNTATIWDDDLCGSTTMLFQIEDEPFVDLVVGSAPDPGQKLDTPNALIDWGDGSQSEGAVQWNPFRQSWDVSGSHEYRQEGAYVIVTYFTDHGGHSLLLSSSLMRVFNKNLNHHMESNDAISVTSQVDWYDVGGEWDPPNTTIDVTFAGGGEDENDRYDFHRDYWRHDQDTSYREWDESGTALVWSIDVNVDFDHDQEDPEEFEFNTYDASAEIDIDYDEITDFGDQDIYYENRLERGDGDFWMSTDGDGAGSYNHDENYDLVWDATFEFYDVSNRRRENQDENNLPFMINAPLWDDVHDNGGLGHITRQIDDGSRQINVTEQGDHASGSYNQTYTLDVIYEFDDQRRDDGARITGTGNRHLHENATDNGNANSGEFDVSSYRNDDWDDGP